MYERGIHFHNIPMLTEKQESGRPKYHIIKTIETLTRRDSLQNGDKKMIDRIERGMKVIKENDQYELFRKQLFRKKEYSYTFSLYSNQLENLQEKQRLLSFDRYKNCFEDALIQTLFLENSTLVVGYISNFYSQKKVLHSWVEISGETVVDYTKNLVIAKQEFQELYNPETINEIPKEEAIEVLKYVEKYDVDARFFALFGLAYLKDLERSGITYEKIRK